MHILFVQFYSSAPAPDFHEMAKALRSWGHDVLVGTPNRGGDLEWRDGERAIAVIPGPGQVSEWIRHIRPLELIATRLLQIRFIMRVRAFIRMRGAEIVQVNPPDYACLIPLLMPKSMFFILDVRQAGEVGRGGLTGKFKNWKSIAALRVNGRYFYDHACFATEAAARRVLGDRWQRWATVHRVGQDPRFLEFRWDNVVGTQRQGAVRFVYIGTLSRVRALEHVFAAVEWLLDRTKDFRVEFVGPDEAGGFYHRLLDEKHLGHVIGLKPAVQYQQVPRIVASFDVALAYVPPLADWKYQPTLKVLEYRALGMPIIASDNEPNRDVVEDGVNGVLINDSVEGLGSAMLRFVEDRDFLRTCQLNARSMRRGRTWSESARRYEEVVYQPAKLRR